MILSICALVVGLAAMGVNLRTWLVLRRIERSMTARDTTMRMVVNSDVEHFADQDAARSYVAGKLAAERRGLT